MSYTAKAEALAKAILILVDGGVDDSHCYRSLVDNLYAYRVGAVNGTGKWDTRKIKEQCQWTISARNSDKVEKEHVVPMAEVVRILLSITNPQISDVYDVIDKYCVYCIVTPEEHSILNVKYQRKMPSEFWDSNTEYYMDAWSRYKLSGLDVMF
ncbi:hypothetical protein VIBRN418_16386 [Vibrio sp. N418]|uniref:Uncharacterized protein n=1 Tax=Vibrio scophthalmi TaxID=45658 RepID=A0A1E3WFH7_9VIBR|nr:MULTISPECIES: hypothetical protein [Vibrio]EGU30882.1 hypothetical protein VIBRN418_16386 [Vibrio sp. N418]ODS04536.1 hypothetical protein VSF3289_03675 [Vibrio scophthalmi]